MRHRTNRRHVARRSALARRNPAARAPKNPMVVLVRRFDPSGESEARWEVLARDAEGAPAFLSLPAATRAALQPPADADLPVGDLIAVVPAEAAAFPEEHARALYVVAPDGVKEAPEPPEELDGSWLARWGQSAYSMLEASGEVDRRRLVTAACDCAETALHLVPRVDIWPRGAIEIARAWCLGRASIGQVNEAHRAAWRAGVNTDAKRAARDALGVAAATLTKNVTGDAHNDDVSRALQAVWYAALATTDGNYDRARNDAMTSMAPLVERWLPLPVVLLSILGYPNAIPFDTSMVPASAAPRANPWHTARRRHPRRHP